MSTKILISVIVLNWNGSHYLGECLGSLLNQDYPDYEVLLVDNGSTDGSVEFVKEKFGKNTNLRVIALKKNYGFSKGNNIGIKYAQGDYVIILNNDTKVKENFITELVKTAESDYQIGSVGCKILFKKGNVWFSQKFMNEGFIVPFFLQTLVEERIETISNSFAINLSNSGCAVLYRKSVLDEVGLFDEDFWSNWEDWDLGYRISLAGFKSIYIPKPLVYHVGGGSEGFSPERYVRIYRNMFLTYFKNYEDKNLLTRFPVFLFFMAPLYHISWLIHRLATRPTEFHRELGLKYLLSMEKAFYGFLISLKIFTKKRYAVQKLRKIPDREVFSKTQLRGLF
jgi:GT2 family glycosyltransferase